VSKRGELAPARAKKRPFNPKERKKRFLLCCEGSDTEPGYFRDLASFLRHPLVEVVIADHETTDPKQIVQQAKVLRADAEGAAKRGRDDNLRYDEVWCVFDRDEHAHFDEAINQATANELSLAVSNPCFELWILLHFQTHTSRLTRELALEKVRKHLPDYNKKITFTELSAAGHTGQAIKYAKRMEDDARALGKWTDNPTSGVWKLVENLCHESNVPIARL
jgi:hypothetical protein